MQPAGGRWVAAGQLKKSRRGVPQNLSELQLAQKAGAAAAGRWDSNRLFLICEGAEQRPRQESAAAGPRATGTAPRARATAGRSDSWFQVAGTARRARTALRRPPGDAPVPHDPSSPAARSPFEGQTFPKVDPSLWTKLVACRRPQEPSAQSAHFSAEMSERKEGRGKGKGKKKDRGSGKKPAPAEGDQSPGECAARVPWSSSSSAVALPSPVPPRPALPALALPAPGVRGAGRSPRRGTALHLRAG